VPDIQIPANNAVLSISRLAICRPRKARPHQMNQCGARFGHDPVGFRVVALSEVPFDDTLDNTSRLTETELGVEDPQRLGDVRSQVHKNETASNFDPDPRRQFMGQCFEKPRSEHPPVG
jgi:hypothetical protein